MDMEKFYTLAQKDLRHMTNCCHQRQLQKMLASTCGKTSTPKRKERLRAANAEVSNTTPSTECRDVVISHMNDASDFYLHYTLSEKDYLKDLTAKMKAYATEVAPFVSPAKHAFCAAPLTKAMELNGTEEELKSWLKTLRMARKQREFCLLIMEIRQMYRWQN